MRMLCQGTVQPHQNHLYVVCPYFAPEQVNPISTHVLHNRVPCGLVVVRRKPDCSCTVTQAKANRGILYVDEVNLLDDGLVDVVLDSAASGLNTVEREGVSIIHPAKFIMLGSGNPQVSWALLLHMCH